MASKISESAPNSAVMTYVYMPMIMQTENLLGIC